MQLGFKRSSPNGYTPAANLAALYVAAPIGSTLGTIDQSIIGTKHMQGLVTPAMKSSATKFLRIFWVGVTRNVNRFAA